MSTSLPYGKPKPLSYPDAIRVFNDDDVMQNLKEACQKLSQSGTALLKTFESISAQLHAFDKQSTSPPVEPLAPRWEAYQKDFSEIIEQHRANAGIISGRLKMFCTVILPLTLRSSGQDESRYCQETAQILQSFMNISSDTMCNTRALVETQLKLNADLTSFHTEFMEASNRRAVDRKVLQDLMPKMAELEKTIRQIYLVNGQVTEPDVTLLAFSALRIPSTSRKRTKLSHRQLMLPGPELSAVKKLYEDLEQTENGIAHVLYNCKVSHRQTDIATTTRIAISSLVSEEILTTEPSLTFFVLIWARLQADCLDILRWLQQNRRPSQTPPCIKAFMESGHTLYLSVADALDVYGTNSLLANRYL
ncbi:hypothetical protein GYMLUDRAFT_47735 [Collybiopsis luxurians FD-317 M1]|uniref:Uncharacterized protein n=1 Tax=Collybiopsis luxurians FD-317 M1 TaxID=944289 RepID=A0A0D0CKE0_9AGAR|nr:hypothetical protein GYMLUDRAFT_47735 [Collybiopsis luxurians FD-317 M1]